MPAGSGIVPEGSTIAARIPAEFKIASGGKGVPPRPDSNASAARPSTPIGAGSRHNPRRRRQFVGVLGVELFVTPQCLIVNEIAPRVHNSGHWTQNGCTTDQFEQHIRAVAGWPLGDGQRFADIVMENLIGHDMDRVPVLAKDPDTALHLYGKAETKPGRKMGHVNRIQPKST